MGVERGVDDALERAAEDVGRRPALSHRLLTSRRARQDRQSGAKGEQVAMRRRFSRFDICSNVTVCAAADGEERPHCAGEAERRRPPSSKCHSAVTLHLTVSSVAVDYAFSRFYGALSYGVTKFVSTACCRSCMSSMSSCITANVAI